MSKNTLLGAIERELQAYRDGIKSNAEVIHSIEAHIERYKSQQHVKEKS